MLASERMRNLLRTARERYQLVIVDAPPLVAVADALPLLPEVTGVLVVVRLGHTRRGDAFRLGRRLRQLRTGALGVVVNHGGQVRALYRSYPEQAMAAQGVPV
jgi:Mrp family chromosome partitioning ATPase